MVFRTLRNTRREAPLRRRRAPQCWAAGETRRRAARRQRRASRRCVIQSRSNVSQARPPFLAARDAYLAAWFMRAARTTEDSPSGSAPSAERCGRSASRSAIAGGSGALARRRAWAAVTSRPVSGRAASGSRGDRFQAGCLVALRSDRRTSARAHEPPRLAASWKRRRFIATGQRLLSPTRARPAAPLRRSGRRPSRRSCRAGS